MRRSHSTQAQSTASHCRLTSPTGQWLFTDAQWGLQSLVAKLHQGHATGFRGIQIGWILSGQASHNAAKALKTRVRYCFVPFYLGQRCQPFIHAGNPTNENGYGAEKSDSKESNECTEKLFSNNSICKKRIIELAQL